MAFIFTVAPLTALYFSATPRFHTAHTEKITYLIIPGTGMPTEQQQPTHVRSRSSNQQQSKQLPSALIPANRSAEPIPLPFETASPIEVPAAVLALPQQTASSPLRIDSEVIRSAIQGTRPQARRMAEGSNAFFGDEPISKSERIAHAVLKAAKPDCFNETSGGTLLSIFVIAYEVARDKCK
jgi:hypothetical protein